MITSPQNPTIKWVHSLQTSSRKRKTAAVFVVEGVRLVEEAFIGGWEAQLMLYSEALSPRGRQVLEGFASRGALVEEASLPVMRLASETETPQGLLAVVRQRQLPLPQPLDLVFIPDAVRDPGNLGTMLRTACAAGAQAVLLPPGSVDPYSPKVLRAAMGAHFRLPVVSLSWSEIRDCLAPLKVYLAAAEAETTCWEADFCGPMALIIGGEAEGAGLQAQRLADEHVCIPMQGGGESLNAAVAAAVLLYEVVRQRWLVEQRKI